MKASIETFRRLSSYELDRLVDKEPYCFNGIVGFRKHRVTVEEIDEPVHVLRERLQKLWDECDNHHHWLPLKAAAKEIGLELK